MATAFLSYGVRPFNRGTCPLQWSLMRASRGQSSLVASPRMAAAKYSILAEGRHPTIDMAPILQRDHPDRATVVQNIGNALKERGYFYAQNVDVLPADYLKSIYDFSRKAHALPIDVKNKYTALDGGGGAYTGLDVGVPEVDYVAGSVSPVRAWDYSRLTYTLAKKDATINKDNITLAGGTSFPPKEILEPAFVDVVDELYGRQNQLASALLTVLAEMFELPPTYFADMFVDEDGLDVGAIRLLYYPGNPEMTEEEIAKINFGISPHTDFEMFTLMHQDAPGLQFMPASGEGWIDAPVRPGEFVVIVGDMLERFTNGILRATPHRVVKTSHKRMSIIRFNGLRPETIVEPLPQFVTEDRPAAYSWVTMRTHWETTIKNLYNGLGSWDVTTGTSKTAKYLYINGEDHKRVSGAQ